MPYLTIDKDGKETMFAGLPKKETFKDDKDNNIELWIEDQPGHFDSGHCDLPKGTIARIVGRVLAPTECFWLNQDERIDEAIKRYEDYYKEEY